MILDKDYQKSTKSNYINTSSLLDIAFENKDFKMIKTLLSLNY